MKKNKIKNYSWFKLYKPIHLVIFLVPLIPFSSNLLNAEYLFEELEIDSSTKTEDNKSVIPTNPFEIVEMIRRHNILNDATDPSDAIDDALKSFNGFEEK